MKFLENLLDIGIGAFVFVLALSCIITPFIYLLVHDHIVLGSIWFFLGFVVGITALITYLEAE